MTVGERIRKTRLEQGLTQQQLADAINISKQAIYKYEMNIVTNIPTDRVKLIAKQLHVTPAYLMGWAESKNEWTSKFCDSVMQILHSASSSELKAAHIDVESIENKLSDIDSLSLATACSIADQLGESLDSLLGHSPKEMIKAALEQEDGQTAEIIELVLDLPENKQTEALNYIRYLSEREGK